MSCENCTRLIELLKYKDLEIEKQRERADSAVNSLWRMDNQQEDFRKGVIQDAEMFKRHEEVIRILDALPADEKLVCHKEDWGIAWEREIK